MLRVGEAHSCIRGHSLGARRSAVPRDRGGDKPDAHLSLQCGDTGGDRQAAATGTGEGEEDRLQEKYREGKSRFSVVRM